MSYRKTHIKHKVQKIKPKKSILKMLWFWILVLVAILIVIIFYFVLFFPGLQVKNINILGNQKVSSQDLQNIVASDSATVLVKFWMVNISTKSILLVSTDKINKDILQKFPLIEKIKIEKNFFDTLKASIIERSPIGVFCSSADQNANCFSIDKNGVVFEAVASSNGDTIVRQTSTSGQIFAGKQVVAQNTIDAIYKIQKDLQDKLHINLKEVLISSPIRLTANTGENWNIYFDLSPTANIGAQIAKLNLLINGGLSQDSRKNLKYINLIPQDRAIVCDNSTCGH